MPINIILNVIIWLVAWIAIRLIFENFSRKGKSFTDDYVKTSLFFLFISIFTVIIFRQMFANYLVNFSITPVVLLVILFAADAFTYQIMNSKYDCRNKFAKAKSPNAYLSMDYRYLIAKTLDILYQQLLIFVLVMILASTNLIPALIILLFAILFVAAHIISLRILGSFFGKYFIVASLAAGLIFPTLILYVNTGLVYSFLVHWIFYTLSGVFFWIFMKNPLNR